MINPLFIFIKGSGSAYSWGFNSNGQLGDGGGSNSNYPSIISGLSNVIQISAGDSHSLALFGTFFLSNSLSHFSFSMNQIK